MKDNNNKRIIGVVLIMISFIATIVSTIWSIVFHVMNPDMTELRLFLENPYPTVIAIMSVVGILIGRNLIGEN